MDIPEFIDQYNLYMCGVNVADQLRSYYTTQRIYQKTWKPLFYFLFNTIVGNCYKISSYGPSSGRRECDRKDTHAQFRRSLRHALFEASTQIGQSQEPRAGRKGTKDITWKPVEEHNLIKLWAKLKNCSACTKAGRKSTKEKAHRGARKPLVDLSINTIRKAIYSKDWKRLRRAPRTLFGCSTCEIPFCRTGECWASHYDKLNTKD
jgi:hypothetical protein